MHFRKLGLVFMLTAANAAAGVTFYATSGAFASGIAGYQLITSENFESGNNGFGFNSFNDSLQPGVANGPFSGGSAAGMTFQSNTLGNNPTTTSPHGISGLTFGPTGTAGVSGNLQPSKQVSANFPDDSFDIILGALAGLNPLAMEMNPTFYRVSGASNTGTLTVRVYNTSNILIGSTTVSNVVDVSESSYLGIQATGADVLGRINIWADANSVEGADNMKVYSVAAASSAPEPASVSLVLVALAGLVIARRK